MDEVPLLKERLAFVEQQYRALQLNMKHQRQASLEAARLQVETNTHFLLGLAPRRYRSLARLKKIYSSKRHWLEIMRRYPFRFALWWTARKFQRNVQTQADPQYIGRREAVRQNIQSIVGAKIFSHIFFMPFISRGGSEKYLLNIINELCQQNPLAPILVILGEDYQGLSWEEKLPVGVDYIDFSIFYHDLSIEERSHEAFRLANSVSRADTFWHFPPSAFATHLFKNFKNALKKRRVVAYRYCNYLDFINDTQTVNYSPYNPIRDGVSFIKKIIADNQLILDEDARRLKNDGLEPIKDRICLYTKAEIIHDIDKTLKNPPPPDSRSPRILWASRLDKHKRPSLIFAIGSQMGQHLPGKVLDVYGYSVFGYDFQHAHLPPSVKFHGAFNGLASLCVKPFDIFLYTSYFDGLPNVLLEAISLGAVVIAPDIGGIGEIIKNNETGILLPDRADDQIMAAAYVEALKKLLNNHDLRTKLAANAQKLLCKNHGPEVFAKEVRRIFGEEI